jgi:hypothetical protein
MLKTQVEEIAKTISEGIIVTAEEACEDYQEGEMLSAYDYLEGALDFRYLVDTQGELIEGRILVAFGGPNIWVHVDNQGYVEVDGQWWGESARAYAKGDPMGLFEAMEELWSNNN